MHKTEDVIQNLVVVGFLLKSNKLIIDGVETFSCLGQKFFKQIIHNENLGADEIRKTAASSGKHCFDLGLQSCGVERLDDVIVHTGLLRSDDVFGLRFCGDHDEGQLRGR